MPPCLHDPSGVFTHGKDPSYSFLLQSQQSQLSYLLFVCWVLQSFNHLCVPLLNFSHMFVSLFYWGTQTGAQHPDVSHECWEEGKNIPFWPVGNIVPDAAHRAVCLLCDKGTWLAHIQLVHQQPQKPFLQSYFQRISLYHVLVHGVSSSPGEGLCSPLSWTCCPVSSAFQGFFCLSRLPFNSKATTWCSNHYPQFCIFCKFAKSSLCPTS